MTERAFGIAFWHIQKDALLVPLVRLHAEVEWTRPGKVTGWCLATVGTMLFFCSTESFLFSPPLSPIFSFSLPFLYSPSSYTFPSLLLPSLGLAKHIPGARMLLVTSAQSWRRENILKTTVWETHLQMTPWSPGPTLWVRQPQPSTQQGVTKGVSKWHDFL